MALLFFFFFSISKVLQNLGNLPAVWDSFDQLDIQQSFLTARTRTEGRTLKIDPESSWGFQNRCSLTRPRKHRDKGNPSYRLILVTHDRAGPQHHLPCLLLFIFHSTDSYFISALLCEDVSADAAIVLEAVRGNKGFLLFFFTFCDPV